jgi:hypothetical protein
MCLNDYRNRLWARHCLSNCLSSNIKSQERASSAKLSATLSPKKLPPRQRQHAGTLRYCSVKRLQILTMHFTVIAALLALALKSCAHPTDSNDNLIVCNPNCLPDTCWCDKPWPSSSEKRAANPWTCPPPCQRGECICIGKRSLPESHSGAKNLISERGELVSAPNGFKLHERDPKPWCNYMICTDGTCYCEDAPIKH